MGGSLCSFLVNFPFEKEIQDHPEIQIEKNHKLSQTSFHSWLTTPLKAGTPRISMHTFQVLQSQSLVGNVNRVQSINHRQAI